MIRINTQSEAGHNLSAPVQKDSSTQWLGNNANKPPKVDKSAQYARFRLLSYAQFLLIDGNVQNTKCTKAHRTTYCHCTRHYNAEAITLQVSADGVTKARLDGVQTCSSVWSCPVCARRVAAEKTERIKDALRWAELTHHVPVHMTLTARHNIATRLDAFLEKFKSAFQAFWYKGTMPRLRKEIQADFMVKAVEVLHGEHGWHYHYHILLFVPKHALLKMQADDGAEFDTWQNRARKSWVGQLKRNGLDGLQNIALKVTTHGDVGENYLTKLGLTEDDTSNSTALELTGQDYKLSRGRTIWALLEDAYECSRREIEADLDYDALYLEYVEAMTGEKWITFTRNFGDEIDRVLAENPAPETEDAPEREYIDLATITDWAMGHVRRYRKVPELLELAHQRDPEKIAQFLKSLDIRHRRENPVYTINGVLAKIVDITRKIQACRETQFTEGGVNYLSLQARLSIYQNKLAELRGEL